MVMEQRMNSSSPSSQLSAFSSERRMRNNNNASSSPRKLTSPIPPSQPTRRSAFSPVNMLTISSDSRWKKDNRDDGSLDSRLKMESQRDITNKTGRDLVDNYRNLSARHCRE
mmetsp:Transcript_29727/g.44226  ORF Transcript_29727/g.44226 Transcript_29727/m.44226 type:complete len:112 (-) Transcript_29727:625-960(-)